VADAKEYVPTVEQQDEEIKGEFYISPTLTYTYSFTDKNDAGTWSISQGAPVKLVTNTDGTISLTWENIYSGNFVLTYTSS